VGTKRVQKSPPSGKKTGTSKTAKKKARGIERGTVTGPPAKKKQTGKEGGGIELVLGKNGLSWGRSKLGCGGKRGKDGPHCNIIGGPHLYSLGNVKDSNWIGRLSRAQQTKKGGGGPQKGEQAKKRGAADGVRRLGQTGTPGIPQREVRGAYLFISWFPTTLWLKGETSPPVSQ